MQANTQIDFKESSLNSLDLSRQDLLSRKINELSLKIQGTNLETLINQLYKELENHGIYFRPKCYLSDDWGCPNGVPAIGIPFYLADPELSLLEGKYTGIEAENNQEIMMYLRHEAGHAFCYAHKLYKQQEWRSLFGLFSKPYKEDYKSKPFSPDFVRHIPGWYAQKHPDEDYAETFAVWLTPEIDWKKRYNDTSALTKLLYVNRTVEEYGKKTPLVTEEILDSPIEEITDTLNEWYEYNKNTDHKIDLHHIIDEDLKILFAGGENSAENASNFLSKKRFLIMQKVNKWTGVDRFLIIALIDDLIKKTNNLSLKCNTDNQEDLVMEVAVFVTTLAMNYLYTDNLVLL